MKTVTATGTPRNGLPGRRDYRWRDAARGADEAELERLRKVLDRQAGYQGPHLARQAPGPVPGPAASPPAPPAAAEPAPPAPPAGRCRACKYLKTSIGHKVNCGG